MGLFPEGMKIAEDLYMWIRIARRYEVCFSPERLGPLLAGGFEPLGGKLHAREDRPFVRGAVRPAGPRGGPGVRGPRRTGKSAYHQRQRRHEGGRPRRRFFAWTRTYRRTLRKVRALNALPAGWRGPVIRLYNALAWRLARKGL